MKLEDRVVSLELSKKFKELGVKQESLWVWVVDTRKPFVELSNQVYTNIVISAFTVAELLHDMPTSVEVNREEYYLTMMLDHPHCYFARYVGIRIHLCDFNSDDGMANPLAQCRIHLIEKGLVSSYRRSNGSL